jgi:hypothetical protein
MDVCTRIIEMISAFSNDKTVYQRVAQDCVQLRISCVYCLCLIQTLRQQSIPIHADAHGSVRDLTDFFQATQTPNK